MIMHLNDEWKLTNPCLKWIKPYREIYEFFYPSLKVATTKKLHLIVNTIIFSIEDKNDLERIMRGLGKENTD